MPREKKSKPTLKKEIKSFEKDIKKVEKNVEKGIEKIEKKVDKEVKEIEAWMVERRKFLIKLGWVAGGIIVLLVVSRLYLRVRGFG